jgi:hypothetical protein
LYVCMRKGRTTMKHYLKPILAAIVLALMALSVGLTLVIIRGQVEDTLRKKLASRFDEVEFELTKLTFGEAQLTNVRLDKHNCSFRADSVTVEYSGIREITLNSLSIPTATAFVHEGCLPSKNAEGQDALGSSTRIKYDDMTLAVDSLEVETPYGSGEITLYSEKVSEGISVSVRSGLFDYDEISVRDIIWDMEITPDRNVHSFLGNAHVRAFEFEQDISGLISYKDGNLSVDLGGVKYEGSLRGIGEAQVDLATLFPDIAGTVVASTEDLQKFQVQVLGLTLVDPRIDPIDPLEIPSLNLEVDATEPSKMLITFTEFFPFFAIRVSKEANTVVVEMASEGTCQSLIDFLPPVLTKGVDVTWTGIYSFDYKATFEKGEWKPVSIEGSFKDHCRVQNKGVVSKLDGPFKHTTQMKNGNLKTWIVGPGSLNFTPYEEISPYMIRAVLATEDASFFKHDGIRVSSLMASLQKNLETDEFTRGGSTLTMQMVKNVFLSHEKHLARKVKELILTRAVEDKFPKERILEVYLNVVEFGPGIYGVTRASEHYFGKYPGELNSLEAAWLASLLPRPVSRHKYWCEGQVSEKFMGYLRKVENTILKGEPSEVEGLVFNRDEFESKSTCLRDTNAVLHGVYPQMAVPEKP